MNHLKPQGGREALLIHESSHDTFDWRKHKNWLVNNAGLGVYAHGRIHQENCGLIYVGDIIHKRGHKTPQDILLMEEQSLDSMGEPLSVPSRLGNLMALAVLPTMSSANGEGDLIAYYERGVVSFSTHEAPRETRIGPDGTMLQKGWDMKRLVNHLLNRVGAVGSRAVTILPRDHFFRSRFGLHFLKIIIGEGTFNSENTNIISQDVAPLLDNDKILSGAATGFWIQGNRMFATTGLVVDGGASSNSFGRGFVSWNQALTYTEDRTPIPAWEGLWRPDAEIKSIHQFTESGNFISSDKDDNLCLSLIRKDLDTDHKGGKDTPIQSEMVTGQFAPLGLEKKGAISEAVLQLTVSELSQKVKVFIRTDVATKWRLWTEFKPCDKVKTKNQKLKISQSLGKPPVSHRECTWFQVKIQVVGYFDDVDFSLDFSPTIGKMGKKSCVVIDNEEIDYFA